MIPLFAPARCPDCGEDLTLAPCPAEDSFQWVGTDGTTRCPAKAYPAEINDPEWWADIRAKTAKGVQEAPAEPWWGQIAGGLTNDVAARYSVLSAALNLCWHPWGKPHRRDGGECTNPEVGRWCHEEPMRWAPSGWVCRSPEHFRQYGLT